MREIHLLCLFASRAVSLIVIGCQLVEGLQDGGITFIAVYQTGAMRWSGLATGQILAVRPSATISPWKPFKQALGAMPGDSFPKREALVS